MVKRDNEQEVSQDAENQIPTEEPAAGVSQPQPKEEPVAVQDDQAEGVEAVEEEAASIVDQAQAVIDQAAQAVEDSASDELAKAQEEAKEWQDRYLRLHAEWDTYRRRTTEQRAAEKAVAAEKLVCGLLPVIDDFERSIDYASKNGETGLLEGVQAVLVKFLDVLRKEGVEVIDPEGEPFDALESQAVATVADAQQFEETVAEVYQKGFRMGKKVLRPAMVTVTTGGPLRKTEE